jgi:predicted kinase
MAATLHVIFGPCGAGKTTYANAFARREKAVAFILDDWMARMFGADMPEPIQYDWMIERVGRCEAQIWATAAGVLAAGTPVILDIGLMRKADRARVRDIAEATGLPLHFHFVDARPVRLHRGRLRAARIRRIGRRSDQRQRLRGRRAWPSRLDPSWSQRWR